MKEPSYFALGVYYLVGHVDQVSKLVSNLKFSWMNNVA